MMSESVELEERLHMLEAKLATYQVLFDQVNRTCGQGNCNCVGSAHVKQIMKELGLVNTVASGSR